MVHFFLYYVSVFLIHCPTSLLLTGMVQGMACLLVQQVRITALFVELPVWVVDAGQSTLFTAGQQDKTEQPVHFTAWIIKVKESWWQVKVTY